MVEDLGVAAASEPEPLGCRRSNKNNGNQARHGDFYGLRKRIVGPKLVEGESRNIGKPAARASASGDTGGSQDKALLRLDETQERIRLLLCLQAFWGLPEVCQQARQSMVGRVLFLASHGCSDESTAQQLHRHSSMSDLVCLCILLGGRSAHTHSCSSAAATICVTFQE